MFNNLKIGVKLAIGFGIAVLFLAIVLFTGLNSLSSVNDQVVEIVEGRFPKTVLANEIVDAVNDNARAIRNMILSDDPTVKQETFRRMDWARDVANKNIEILTEKAQSDGERALIVAFNKVRGEYFDERQKMLAEFEAGNTDGVLVILFGGFRQAQNEYIGAIENMIEYQTNQVNQRGTDAAAAYSSASTLMLILGILALVLVIAFAWFITNSIVKPVNMVKERMTQLDSVCITNLGGGLIGMSKGDLSIKVEKGTKHLNITSNDEIGQMAKVFDAMLTKAQGGIDAYETVREKVRLVSNELTDLIDDSKNGKLSSRGDAQKFEGTWSKLVEGVNNILDEVIAPVQEGSRVLEIMANGDLTPRVTGNYKGDHQIIKNSINQLGDSLSAVISQVNEAVEATASAATQISSSSEEMAAGAQEQSAQATEVASAVEQMTATILQTTKHAATAADKSKKAGATAKDGGNIVAQTVQGMNRIADVVMHAAEAVQELGKNSDKIGEIVQVIDDIADQTNLLALNAAIEAARAGEQGRGFAVVADEVRKLAERTTKATKEIASMIRHIQKDTSGAVESMHKGTEEVNTGKQMAEKAGSALNEIISGADEVVDVVTQVAAASEEQSAAAEQIGKNIESISAVTQQSAAGTQQIARAAEDLNQLTDKLQKLISQFKIDNKKTSHSNLTVRQNGKLVEV